MQLYLIIATWGVWDLTDTLGHSTTFAPAYLVTRILHCRARVVENDYTHYNLFCMSEIPSKQKLRSLYDWKMAHIIKIDKLYSIVSQSSVAHKLGPIALGSLVATLHFNSISVFPPRAIYSSRNTASKTHSQ